ncbi:MAG: gliding motility-associated C-terminal domain-containing protein [Bacteroidetes bacterium]|nr:gliding motility-associated C-terminal domain-containing protein [Bacteroidota bacterium]
MGSGSCDSVVTLNLTVSNVLSSSFAKTICSGQSYFFNGINQTTTGIYKDTLVGSGSCDSVVTLNLTVSNVLSSNFAKTICSGQSYFFNGINQTTTGIYKDTLVGSGSCDSVVTLNLTVSNVLSSSFAKTICSGQSYFFNGINRTATGIYKDTLVGSGSCDSVVTLNLTVSNVLSSSFAKTICSGQSYFFNGINQTTTGIYKDTLVGSGSCDSVVTLNLTVSNVLSSSFAKTICSGQSYFFNGINQTTTGIYKDTLVGSGSCDSVVTLNLTVSNVNLDSIINLGPDIEACQGDTIILKLPVTQNFIWQDGSISSIYSITRSGLYGVSYFDSCGSYVDEIEVNFIDCSCKVMVPNVFSPNGDALNDVFNINSNCSNFSFFELNIFNRWSQLIFSSNKINNCWDGTFNQITQPVDSYIYHISYMESGSNFMKNIKGIVTLIR